MIVKRHTKELLNLVDDIPTIPDVWHRIECLLNDPDSDINDMAEVVKQDASTSAMIMKMANSIFYNPSGREINSIDEAIMRLGMNEVADIARAMSLIYGLFLPYFRILSVKRIWSHSLSVAMLAKKFAELCNGDSRVAYTAGLLHDIGKIVLGTKIDINYFDTDLLEKHEQELCALERDAYGYDHAEIGDALLHRWGMPSDICLIVRNHHTDAIGSTECMSIKFADQFVTQAMPKRIKFESVPDFVVLIMDDAINQFRANYSTLLMNR
ncbi:MAG: HDOD domain-containing protein [Methanobacteriota archaeon]|nr:MAG: HDOD domain-containing protein [Euryarchaeota archaeon]